MFEWLFKKDDSTTIDVLEVIARDLTKVQLAAMAQEKAAGMSDFAGENANTKRYFRKIILVVKCAGN